MNGLARATMPIKTTTRRGVRNVIPKGTVMLILWKAQDNYWVMPPWGHKCLVCDYEIEVLSGMYREEAFTA